ncbi:glycoside hydrolase family 16 protein [Aureobasidium subglaciale EXF-2481]|uniref:Glycoside hydrolase family 16 protein n=1 Tax=Aureobasidium subglaciale (strain EXF-2481) TaxID=1043005 RepID=A0A074Y4E9_AURSE|nr:glycoside hydrolase family 16 protein [Aureobasidium subglaciale EXF-2481]KEQ90839.1 glycoside hydrolase family 16 protein [Aureobasidium subglaciale EXF-2481]
MGFRDSFKDLQNKAQAAMSNNAPPIPWASKPGSSSSSSPAPPPQQQAQPYWQPNCSPDTPVSANFKHEQGNWGWGNNEAQNYVDDTTNSFHTPYNALVVHAIINHSHPQEDRKFTSARLSSHQTLSRSRGNLSARITAPLAAGIWPAFWLLPQDPFVWPTDGEMDIFEAWNGDPTNHTCMHWGHFNGPDHDKHRVVETPIPNITSPQGIRFDFTWEEDEASGTGRMIWYIDGKAVMKASKPAGTRPMRDFRILINVAVGGNVCQGVMPKDGTYEFVVRELGMWDAPPGGWDRFQRDWKTTREGHGM